MGAIFKALAVVALSLLASMNGDAPKAPDVKPDKGRFLHYDSAQIAACVPDAQTLCLNGGRFRVLVAWRVPSQGLSGVGTGVSLTTDTGYFWFFSPNNIELVIKVVDGRGVNGMYWVFYGALSDVEYTITVADSATGAVRTYSNPSGNLASVADTAAFSGSLEDPGPASVEPTAANLQAAACAPDSTTLCLNGGRFQVQVSWRVPSQGTSGVGTATTLTGDTGEFWFFSSNNIELVIKVLDGTAVNGKYWVFYGALSDVEYSITVTDTLTGNVKTFVNPSGKLASVADTSGFDAPATPTPTPTPPSSTTHVVNVGPGGTNAFQDSVGGNNNTSVRVGETVQWVFQSGTHSATSGQCRDVGGYYDDGGCTPDGSFDTGVLGAGATFSWKTAATGSYRYYCAVHGSMMTGTVTVNP